MPSLQRRMALTLPEEVKNAVFDLADALQKPAATVVTELLQEMVPQLHDLAKLTRLTKAGKTESAKRVLRHMIGDAAAELASSSQPDLFPSKKTKK